MEVYRVKTGSILPLGKQGENLVRQIQFDLSRWISNFGPGTVQLLHQRSGDEAPYPVAVEQDGNLAVWTVTSADTAAAGTGRAELQYYVGDALAKSETWMTKVFPALGDASETPPEAQQGWVDQVLQAGTVATEAAEKAANAAVRQPIVGGNGNWWTWDPDAGAYGDTGIYSGGDAPYIGDNGNWYVGQTDTGIPATGPAGPAGATGPAGKDGSPGENGRDGVDGQAATFEIVNTETLEPGQPAAVTEAEGSTAQARKYKLSVPQGEKGDPGSVSFETVDGTDLVVDWTFTDGMPEDNGLTYTGTEGKAVMQSDGLLLSTGAEYKPPVLTASNAAVECVFSSPNFGDYYGFRLQLTNGTTGIRISCYNNKLIYNQHTTNNLTLANLTTDTDYTLRIAWDEESGADVYLNGEAVLTGGKTSYALAENLVNQVSGGGTTLLKSLTYTFPGMGHEIVAIDGKKLRDETARAMAMQGGGAGLTVTNTAAVGQTVKITAVDETGQPAEWEAVDMEGVPTVTTANNGQFLRVVNGAWAAFTVPNAEEASF